MKQDPETSDRPAVKESTAGKKRKLSLPKRLTFATIALSVLISALCLLTELYLRLSGWEIRSSHPVGSLYQHHPIFGREHVPDREVMLIGRGFGEIRFKINRDGFRDPNPLLLERTNKKRILAIGDSFTWGWGVRADQSFPELLEERTGAEVLNMGHNGYGTGQEWLMLRERGMAYTPDIVLLSFYVGNDFQDNVNRSASRPHFYLKGGGITVRNLPVPHSFSDRFSGWMKKTFLSYYFLGYHGKRLRYALRGTNASRRWMRDTRHQDQIYWDDVYRSDPTKAMLDAQSLTFAILIEIKKLCETSDVRLLLVIVPSKEANEDDVFQRGIDAMGVERSQVDAEYPLRLVATKAGAMGIPVLDLNPHLKSAKNSRGVLHLEDDEHWNAIGHEVVSEAIHRKIEALGWLK